jgi:hypothetical protein
VKTLDDFSPLEKARAIDGATQQNSEGRYFYIDQRGYHYGYRLHFTGAYVCYTCGHLCECNEE